MTDGPNDGPVPPPAGPTPPPDAAPIPSGAPGAPTSSGARPPAEKPRWKAIVIMVVGGLVLAVGGCGTFLATMQNNQLQAISVVGAIGFVAGLVLFAIGTLTALVVAVMRIVRGARPRS